MSTQKVDFQNKGKSIYRVLYLNRCVLYPNYVVV